MTLDLTEVILLFITELSSSKFFSYAVDYVSLLGRPVLFFSIFLSIFTMSWSNAFLLVLRSWYKLGKNSFIPKGLSLVKSFPSK